MRTIPIYIYDQLEKEKIEKENEKRSDLGMTLLEAVNKSTLVTFHFNERNLTGYWIDPEENDDTGTRDIVVYIGSSSFRTPYSEKITEMLDKILIINANDGKVHLL